MDRQGLTHPVRPAGEGRRTARRLHADQRTSWYDRSRWQDDWKGSDDAWKSGEPESVSDRAHVDIPWKARAWDGDGYQATEPSWGGSSGSWQTSPGWDSGKGLGKRKREESDNSYRQWLPKGEVQVKSYMDLGANLGGGPVRTMQATVSILVLAAGTVRTVSDGYGGFSQRMGAISDHVVDHVIQTLDYGRECVQVVIGLTTIAAIIIIYIKSKDSLRWLY